MESLSELSPVGHNPIKMEHLPISFRLTKLNNDNGFTHYGFSIEKGKVILNFVEIIYPNGERGKLWKREETYNLWRRMEVPVIPKDIETQADLMRIGFIVNNL